MHKPFFAVALGFLALASASGCHTPSGGFFSFSGGSQTYYSNEMMQKSITMIDTRTNEVFFRIDIPPGKQFTYDIDAGDGDDPVNRPDIMFYEVMDQGTQTGKLHNSLTVPNASCRLIKVDIRRGVEYAAEKPDRQLRTDEVQDRPAWWSPEGGPLPEDKKASMYDH